MKMFLVVISLAALCSSAISDCVPGLAVYNKTNIVLSPTSCNDVIDIKSLAEEPTVTYNKANFSETYLLMLLEALPNNHELFILHWLIAGIKPSGVSLPTKMGVRDLIPGYIAPVNQTQYEFRLYNMTGKVLWETVNAAERNFFLPTQWLNKNNIFSPPLAKTTFNVKAYIPGPAGWVVPPYPVGSQPPPYPVGNQPPPYPVGNQPPPYPVGNQPPPHPVGNQPPPYPVGNQPPAFPAQYPPAQQPPQMGHPAQHLPNYPTQPPLYPQLPVSQHPAQQLPPSHPQQPIIPVGQPHPPVYPSQHPAQPSYPTQVVPQPPRPHYPANFNTASTGLHVQTQYNVNGTVFRILTHDRSPNNILNINSTMYTSDTYNKRFRLTPYLIIDNISYIWRNYTHSPGRGQSVYINGTLYVPFAPSKEIHHYHYHKGAGTALNPTILLFTFLIPSLLCIFHS